MAAEWLAALALAQAAPAPPPPPPPDWDLVSFEVKSWGRTVHRWSIGKQGGGSWIEPAGGEQPDERRTVLVDEVGHYVALEKILRALPAEAPDYDRCDQFMSDAPYGTLRLTRGRTTREFEWNSGCMDPAYQQFMVVLKKADEAVKGWREAAPAR